MNLGIILAFANPDANFCSRSSINLLRSSIHVYVLTRCSCGCLRFGVNGFFSCRIMMWPKKSKSSSSLMLGFSRVERFYLEYLGVKLSDDFENKRSRDLGLC